MEVVRVYALPRYRRDGLGGKLFEELRSKAEE